MTVCALFSLSSAAAGPQYGIPQTDYTSTGAWGSSAAWDASSVGRPLNRSLYATTPTYYDSATCDVGGLSLNSGNGAHAWYTISGVAPGNGGTVYVTWDSAPVTNGLVTCPGDGFTHFNAKYNADTTWHMGNIVSQDTGHEGFQLQYGYFEFKARFNSASLPLNPWGALWNWSREAQNTAASYSAFQYEEFDIIETCLVSAATGGDCAANKSSMHQWPGTPPGTGQVQTHRFNSCPWTAATFDNQFHTYGLHQGINTTIVYRDQVEVCRFHVVANDMRNPLELVMDVASYWGTGGANTGTTYDVMDVQYAEAFPCLVINSTGCP